MKASQATTLFNRLRCQLYSEGNCLPNSWGKAVLSIGLATIVGLTGVTYGCALVGKNPPVIQNYKIPEWAVEGEKTDIEVSTFDDKGTKSAYVQLNNGLKIPLSKVSRSVEKGETAEWKGGGKIPVGDYEYIIVVKDSAGNKSDHSKNKGKITIYPFDADNDGIGYRDEVKYGLDPNKRDSTVIKYLVDKNLGVFIPILKTWAENTVMDENTKAMIDLVALYYPKIEEIFPGAAADIVGIVYVSSIDMEYIGYTKTLFELASNPKFRITFELMLSRMKGNRKELCVQIEQYSELVKNKEQLRIGISRGPFSPIIANVLKDTPEDELSEVMDALLKLYPKYCGAVK